MNFPILSSLILLPTIGALFLMFSKEKNTTTVKYVSLFTSFVNFLISIYLYLTHQKLFDFSLLIPLGIMFIVGVYDDFYNADFKLKFFLQIIVAKILIDQGFLIDHFHGILGLQEIPRLASQFFTVFVFLVIVNAINFIDGIDGLAITELVKVILIIELFFYNLE